MSSKSPKGPKRISLPVPPVPRDLESIQTDYQQTALQAGQAQYQAFVYSEDLKSLNRKLLGLNREAAERNTLNAAAPKKEGTDGQPA